MFYIKSFIVVLLLSILPGISVFSQANVYSVAGNVSDKEGAKIPNATVVIRNVGSGFEKESQTDGSGNFIFQNLRNGNYQLTIKQTGFSTKIKDLMVNNSNLNNVEISLSVGDISEQITVTATRTQVSIEETPVTVSILDREDIERKNLNTIGDAFRTLPGVSTVNEGSFQVRPRIRGFDSNRVLVLVDGERLNNGRTSTVQSGIELGLVGTEQIQTLEVVRGSGSVLYGTDALGGTINIITRDAPRNLDDGFRFGAVFNGFFSSNERGRRGSVSLNGSSKFFSFRVAQSLERYGNYQAGDLDNRQIDGVRPNGEVLNAQSHGSNTKVTTRFFFNDDNDLKLNYDRRRVGNIGVPTLVGVFNAYFPFSNRDKFNGRFETRNLTKKLARISGTFYYQKQDRNFITDLNVPAAPPFFPGQTDFSDTKTETDSFGFDLQSDWLLDQKHFLTAGFSFFRDENKDSRFQELFLPNFRTFPPSLTQVIENSPSVPNAELGSFAFFTQDQFEVNSRLKLVGGIRIERFFTNSSPTDNFALPAIITPEQIEALGLSGLLVGLDTTQTAITGDFGAIFQLTDELSLTGRIGRSFRVPNIFERFFTGSGSLGGIIVGNPNLEPESGINIDTGVRFKNSKFAGSVTYFNNLYKNLLSNERIGFLNGTPVIIPNGLFQTENIGRARIQGIEADFEIPIKLGLGFLTPSGSISYLRGDNLEDNVPLTTISPLKTVFNLRWTNFLNNYYVDWTTRIVNKQERLPDSFIQINGGIESGFTVSDLGGGYVYKREKLRLSFNAGIKNLFDRFYREQFVLAPARGRSFVFGTTWELN
jgi:hemoglobin/transferrin/lactoferrin receptor protein